MSDPITQTRPRLEPWWGKVKIAHGASQLKRIGSSLDVWIQRLGGEWRIARNPAPGEHDPERLERFASADAGDELELLPVLADRPVVARPEHPFSILPRQACTVFVGTPLWLRIQTPGDHPVQLTEFPIQRPSDTWFGPNPMVGELCYVSRTYCKIRREDVEPRPERALTAVSIRNNADTPLFLERLKLPVEYLSLYENEGGLWTQDIAFDREEGQPLSALSLRDQPRGSSRAGTKPLMGPRKPPTHNLFVRAFTSWLNDLGVGDE
jgi:hypothetical protein